VITRATETGNQSAVDYPVTGETADLLLRWHNRGQARRVQAYRANAPFLEEAMRKSARAIAVDEYISAD
jgi:hypothetical protein